MKNQNEKIRTKLERDFASLKVWLILFSCVCLLSGIVPPMVWASVVLGLIGAKEYSETRWSNHEKDSS